MDSEHLLAEVRAQTNKPRFCFFGYAPPVCIGDAYEKKLNRKNNINGREVLVARSNILCRGSRSGSNADALFSAPSSLYVGDAFTDQFTAEKKFYRPELTQEIPKVFRQGAGPVACNPWPPHMRDSVDVPDAKSHVKELHEKWEKAPKPFIPLNSACTLFEKKIEYVDPRPRLSKAARAHPNDTPPFRVNYGLRECFWKYPEHMSTELRANGKKAKSNRPCTAPFKPAGFARLQGETFTGYMSPKERKSSIPANDPNKPPWRSSPVPVTSSPIPSIVALNVI